MAETCTHHLPPFNKQRKRKRLSQVVDKLTTQVVKSSPPPTPPPSAALLNNNFQHHNKNHNLEPMLEHMLEPVAENSPSTVKSGVFRFDSVDRERYTYAAISEEEDVFSPRGSSTASSPHIVGSSDKLPFSPRDSPFSPGDSPKVPFSPMCIKDDGEEIKHGPSQPRYPGCACAHCSPLEVTPMDRYFPGGVPPSPVSPLTPCTPSPINNFEHYLHSKYLPDIFRRRSHSDSDIPMWFEGAALSIKSEVGVVKSTFKNEGGGGKGTRQKVPLTLPTKGGSLESENSTPQDSPLDLSVRGSRGSSTSSVESLSRLRAPTPSSKTPPTPPQHHQDVTTSYLPRSLVPVPVVRGDVASPTTKESVAHRYNLEVSPVVEEMPPGSDVAYVCPVCGQMFSLHDRLAKHMASRHKTKQQADLTAKAYLCDVCQRSFARSDMLTRHMRLHTGIKPYTCRVCGQVFSRSDHLSTHQRTHTGEKPYRCPQCPYAACRRDMITRHMRTHARYEAGSIAGSVDDGSGGGSDSPRGLISPPPLSPSQALSSLSVHSPSPSSPTEPMDND